MHAATRSLTFLLVVCVVAACNSTGDGADTTISVQGVSSTAVTTDGAPDVGDLVNLDAWIAYQGPAPDGSDGVILIHPDGTGSHEIGDDVGSYGLPDWSPDGTRVVFTTRGGDTEPIYEYDLASETSTQLFTCEDPCLGDDEPSYSADGKTIIFVRAFLPLWTMPPQIAVSGRVT